MYKCIIHVYEYNDVCVRKSNVVREGAISTVLRIYYMYSI